MGLPWGWQAGMRDAGLLGGGWQAGMRRGAPTGAGRWGRTGAAQPAVAPPSALHRSRRQLQRKGSHGVPYRTGWFIAWWCSSEHLRCV